MTGRNLNNFIFYIFVDSNSVVYASLKQVVDGRDVVDESLGLADELDSVLEVAMHCGGNQFLSCCTE